jgi:aerotolerance regulator-like protein
MTLLSPGFLWGAIAVAAGIIGLHFIVTRQPRATVLPTARFVPDSAATATVRDARPSDLLLMLLRVLVVLAAGAALARPIIKPSRQTSGRVFLMDDSRGVASVSEAADSVKRLYRAGDAVIVFDSAARSLGPNPIDSLDVARRVDARGNTSAALIASLREASALRDKVDSMELVIVSPLLDEERDAATDSIRKLWRGRARLVRIAPRSDSAIASNGSMDIRSTAADGLVVSVSLASKSPSNTSVRIVRAAPSPDDTAWSTAENHVLVVWPISDRPSFAITRSPADQSGGVVSYSARLVAAFDRRWIYPADSVRGARVIARWADGEPAAVEKKSGQGCITSVDIPVANVGDLVIRPEFIALLKDIAAPCEEPHSSEPAPTAVMASLSGGGSLAPSDVFAARNDVTSPLAPWLLGIALAAALGELFLRTPTTARS